MELKRVARAVAGRWVVVVAISLVGVAAALVITQVNNSDSASLYEATAAIKFEPEEGQTIADLAPEIQDAREFATIAASDLLEEDPGLLIVEDLASARLEFVAQGSTEAAAGAKASALLQSFLDTDPTLGGSVSDLIAELETEARETQQRIDELQPSLTADEQALVDEHQLIDQEIIVIRDEIVGLVLEEAAADAEGRAEIASRRAFLTSRLEQLQADKAALPPPPTAELSVDEALLLATLERRMEQITSEYERLYLRQLGVTGRGTPEAVTFTDLTPAPANPWLNASIGMLGGLAIAVFAVMSLARTRRTVWLAEDVPVPLLGEIPSRRVDHSVADDWYDRAEPGARKTAIQALRSVVEAQVPGEGTTIGVTRHDAPDGDTRALAADLAASMATAGKTVLLIDADFGATGEIGRYRADGTSLSSVLKFDPGAPEFAAQVDQSADSAHVVRPGLGVIPSGPAPSSPADALAGRQFRAFISAAQERYDVVMVVVDDLREPSARVPLQRLEYGIVALTPGKSTMPDLEANIEFAHRLRITMLGAVFLRKQSGMSRLAGRWRSDESQTGSGARPQGGEAAPSPISRLSTYSSPEENRTKPVDHNPLRDLAERVAEADPDSEASIGGDLEPVEGEPSDLSTDPFLPGDDDLRGGFGHELVRALSSSSEKRAFGAVAEYLVSRTEDMVNPRHGADDFSQEVIRAVAESGFASLSPLQEKRTVASWLKLEIAREAGDRAAGSVIEEMERVVSAGRDEGVSLDDWLKDEFFRRHLSRTEGEPTVWHLASSEGTVGILVPALRLTRARVEDLIGDVARVKLDEVLRFRDAANTRGDIERAEMLDLQVAEVRQFQSGLERIAYGSEEHLDNGYSDAWIADWSLGIRSNLAFFQRAGLLPFPVLSDEEMSSALAPA